MPICVTSQIKIQHFRSGVRQPFPVKLSITFNNKVHWYPCWVGSRKIFLKNDPSLQGAFICFRWLSRRVCVVRNVLLEFPCKEYAWLRCRKYPSKWFQIYLQGPLRINLNVRSINNCSCLKSTSLKISWKVSDDNCIGLKRASLLFGVKRSSFPPIRSVEILILCSPGQYAAKSWRYASHQRNCLSWKAEKRSKKMFEKNIRINVRNSFQVKKLIQRWSKVTSNASKGYRQSSISIAIVSSQKSVYIEDQWRILKKIRYPSLIPRYTSGFFSGWYQNSGINLVVT